MRRKVIEVIFCLFCVASLWGCGNGNAKSSEENIETTESANEVVTASVASTEEDDNEVMAYFQENGEDDGDTYLVTTEFGENMSAEWTISKQQPEILFCHVFIDNNTESYFQYYLTNRIITYKIDWTTEINSKETIFKTYGLVDEAAYQDGDTNTLSRLLVDGIAIDPSEYGGAEDFDYNVNILIPIFCNQLKTFGVKDSEISSSSEVRTEEEMLQLLPADDECAEIINTTTVDSISKIPEEYAKDADSLELYDAVIKGETDYLVSILGECDTIKNVENNRFSSYVGGLLDEVGFYDANELQQNFLEMYALWGYHNDSAAIFDPFQTVFASGYYDDGRGNADNIIDTSYIVGRCIGIQTKNNSWLILTNQLVGSINTYPSEKISQVEVPQVENDKFELEYGDIPFTFKKVDGAFFSYDRAMKAYKIGQLIYEFNTEYVESWNAYYQEKEAAKYEPGIGMTKQEVLNSTWGSPKDKNITELQNSTHEQWVYGNGRYVYFEDGIVTAIQK